MGVRQSDVCVAYAAGADTVHPADPQLLWHVWDSLTMTHVPDVDIISTDAPASLSFLGHGLNRENNVVNGEYDLVGAYHGLPAYLHRNGRIAIRFNAHERRWLLSQVDDTGNMCSAFTEAGCSRHPGEASLDWHFWELERRAFVPDPLAKAVVAPGMLHIVGRLLQAENARINGTYYLADVKDKRPLYVKPGTHGVIRYSAKHDWWLIDCDGLEKPSIMTRLFHWILSGDSSAATDRCSAFAEARGTAGKPDGEVTFQIHAFAPQSRQPWCRCEGVTLVGKTVTSLVTTRLRVLIWDDLLIRSVAVEWLSVTGHLCNGGSSTGRACGRRIHAWPLLIAPPRNTQHVISCGTCTRLRADVTWLISL